MRTKRLFHIPTVLLYGIVGIGGVILCCLLYVMVLPHTYPVRIGVAVIGKPYIVVSYDTVQRTAVIVVLPPSVSMQAVHMYGTYQLQALWSLDELEKRRGGLFSDTLEENLGLPVRFYVKGRETDKELSDVELLSLVQESFSFRSFFMGMTRPGWTNMPLPYLMTLAKGIQGLDKKDATMLWVGGNVTNQETLPDETVITSFDPKRFSLLLGTHAEDTQVRKETPRVALFNTTKTQGLAQNVARLLEGLGVHVVSVGNDETTDIDDCILRGAEDMKETMTAKSISWLYRCRFEIATDVPQVDYALYLGKAFEKRFLPYGK